MTLDRESLGWLHDLISTHRKLVDLLQRADGLADEGEAGDLVQEAIDECTEDPDATEECLRECQRLHDELLGQLPADPLDPKAEPARPDDDMPF